MMQHAQSTKANDALTQRLFQQYLLSADLHTRWKGKVNTLRNVVQLPVINQEEASDDGERNFSSATDSPRIFFMKGISSPHSRPKRAGKFVFAVFNTANAALGTGVLGFPYAYRQSGWMLGLLITVGSALLLGYCMTIILRCARKYEGASYQEMVFQMYGRRAGQSLILMIFFINFMCGTAYLLVINSQISYFLGSSDDNFYTSYVFIMCMASVLAFPFSQYRSIDSLGSTSMIGVIAVLFFVVVIIVHAFTDPKAHDSVLFSTDPRAIQTIPIVFFAIFCHITVVPATAQLLEYWPSKTNIGKTRFKSLVTVCIFVMALCFLFYGPAGVAGYLLYGTQTAQNVLDNMGKGIDVSISRVCMIVTTFASLPITTIINRGASFDLLHLPNEIETLRMLDITIYNVVYYGLTAAIAIGLQYTNQGIGFVMSIVGSTSGVAIQVGFPAIFSWTMGNRMTSVVLMFFAIAMGVSGLFITIILAICGEKTTGYCSFAS